MTKKELLKQKILEALEKRIGKNTNLPVSDLSEKRQKVISLVYQKLIEDGKLTEKNINKKIDNAISMIKEQSENESKSFDGMKKAFSDITEKQTKELINAQKEFPTEIIVSKNEKERKSDIDLLTSLLGTFFTSLVEFFTKLSKGVFKVRLNTEHYLTPQKVVLIDPHTMKAFNLKDLQNNPQVVVNESVGGYVRIVGLKNKAGQEINPASEEGLTELGVILKDALETKSDEVKIEVQNTNDNINLLKQILRLLKPLSIVTGGGRNNLAVDIASGVIATVTTVTTVSTVANQTNMGNVSGFTMQQALLRNAFANGIRNNLS